MVHTHTTITLHVLAAELFCGSQDAATNILGFI